MIAKQIGFFAAVILVASATVFAQRGQPPGASGESDAQKMEDQSFVRTALENNATQIRLSQLATQKASSPDVKDFSTQMVQVHTQLDSQLQPVARQMSIGEPKGPSKKEKKEIAKLEALSGPSFDAEYLQAMAMEQQESLKYFRGELQDSQSPTIQQMAKVDTPALTQHFQVLEQIAHAHNVELNVKEKK